MTKQDEQGLVAALLSLTRQVNDLQAFKVAVTRALKEMGEASPAIAPVLEKVPGYQAEALQEVLFMVEDSNPWLASLLANRPADPGKS